MNALIKRLFNLRDANFSRNSHLPVRRTFANAHGVTLVEIMLVLLISGIVFSGLITSYFNVQRVERNKEAIQQVETIKQAIVAYAATHKTANREIYVQVTLEFSEVKRAVMPAGRPYLPCPDVTGDGLEDRVTPPNPTESATLSFASINNARGFYEEMDAPQMRDYSLWYPGSCYSSRGIVPWRTLGTPPVDPWGNRHTYRVMPSFAGAAHGFDQNTPAVNVGAVFAMNPSTMSLQITVISAEGFSQQKNATLFALQAPVSHPTGRYQGTNLSLSVIGPNFVYFAPVIVCSQPPCPPLELGIENYAGQIVAGNITVVGAESFPGLIEYGGKGGVEAQFTQVRPKVSGVPFVIVSHGKNGYGAVRGSEDVEYKCNPFPSASGSTVTVGFKALAENSERVNAVFSNADNTGCAVIAAVGQEADNAGLDYGFIDGINHGTWGDSDYGYDDIVGWMSAEDLAAELGRVGVFPARHLPLLTNQAGF